MPLKLSKAHIWVAKPGFKNQKAERELEGVSQRHGDVPFLRGKQLKAEVTWLTRIQNKLNQRPVKGRTVEARVSLSLLWAFSMPNFTSYAQRPHGS